MTKRTGEDISTMRAFATTLGDLLLSARDHAPDKTAVVFPGARLSYQQFVDRSMRRARSLWAIGVRPQHHVGILMPSGVEFLETLFAICLCGGVAVLLNARYRSQELAYVAENADLTTLLTTTDKAEHVDFVERLHDAFPDLREARSASALELAAAPKLRRIVLYGEKIADGFVSGVAFDAGADSVDALTIHRARLTVRVRDTCMMLYTSGTSANPKGCLLTHEAVTREVMNVARYRWELDETDVCWSPLPLYHIAALTAALAGFAAGGTFVGVPHFEAGESLRQIASEGATMLFVPFVTVLQALVEHPDFSDADLSSVRVMNCCFVMMPDSIGSAFRKKAPHILSCGTYGMTETTGIATTGGYGMDRELGFTRLGFPMPGVEIKVVDRESGAELPAGEIGEALLRGYSLFSGYYRDPEKSAEAIDSEGWLHSGDCCSLDEHGHLMFHGRFKDMLKVGGENVAASEVEACLQRHPAVKLSQVVGIPDARLTEVPAAFVELYEGSQATAEELIAFTRERIASFKAPRHVRFVNEWPMSTSKIQKFKLRKELLDELGLTA